MKYKAIYDIDHGVSHGLGSCYPDHSEEEYSFDANSPEEAMRLSDEKALEHLLNFLSNPDTGKTQVNLTRLLGPDGPMQIQPYSIRLGPIDRALVSKFLEDGYMQREKVIEKLKQGLKN